MNYIKIFQIAQALLISVWNTYSEDQLMHTFLDKFCQGEQYSTQIANHQAELRREGEITDQKSLSVSSLQTDYFNIGSSSVCGGKREREIFVQKKWTFGVGANNSSDFFQKEHKE